MISVVVVTGPVGVGKSAVTWEMAEVLDERGVDFLRYDADAVHYRPHPDHDRFGERVTVQVLEYTWGLVRSPRVLLPKVVETRSWVDRYRAIIPDSDMTIVRLTAPRDVVASRLREREIGAGLEWHLARAIELEEHWAANPVEDFTVENVGPVRGVALAVLQCVGWV